MNFKSQSVEGYSFMVRIWYYEPISVAKRSLSAIIRIFGLWRVAQTSDCRIFSRCLLHLEFAEFRR